MMTIQAASDDFHHAGTLSPGWVTIPELELLDLSFNRFYGEIPANWDTGFPDMAQLRLDGNELSSGLPADWITGEQDSAPLHIIDLGNNPGLRGELAEWQLTEALPGLEYLNVSGNSLTGSLPANLTGLQQLKALNVSNMKLQGGLPEAWAANRGVWPLVEVIDLHGNNITGSIPANYFGQGLWPRLQVMDLSYLSLTGTLPTWRADG
ncbi:hypothetical protein WJX73_008614 [Symbiochloris irregularis]|uniref:Uncharacterized protein n=1 Tax=Symbiochloris irregularis TaxID=706552 RepID=A0AAW1P619_9CHLO